MSIELDEVRKVIVMVKSGKYPPPSKQQTIMIMDKLLELAEAYEVANDGRNFANDMLEKQSVQLASWKESYDELEKQARDAVAEKDAIWHSYKDCMKELATMTAKRDVLKQFIEREFHDARILAIAKLGADKTGEVG